MRKIGSAVIVASVVLLGAACGSHTQTTGVDTAPSAGTATTVTALHPTPPVYPVPADQAPPNAPPLPADTPP